MSTGLHSTELRGQLDSSMHVWAPLGYKDDWVKNERSRALHLASTCGAAVHAAPLVPVLHPSESQSRGSKRRIQPTRVNMLACSVQDEEVCADIYTC